MSENRGNSAEAGVTQQGAKSGGFIGSLKDALAAASRDDTMRGASAKPGAASEAVTKPSTQKIDQGQQMSAPTPPEAAPKAAAAEKAPSPVGAGMSAAEAAAEVKGQTSLKAQDKHVEFSAPPTTRVVKDAPPLPKGDEGPARTQLVRGKVEVQRGTFQQDPVVGWLVIVGGPGIGSFRPIFEGNNTVGRNATQRIPLDFGDDSISSEEQAYIRYDSSSRSFLFVPNLAKTNIVSVNDKRPTGAVELNQMDVITMGRTQIVFVPFCGPDFDWAELTDNK